MDVKKKQRKPSAALQNWEFSRVPPHKEEEKALDPHKFSTTGTKLLSTFSNGQIYIYNIYIIYI